MADLVILDLKTLKTKADNVGSTTTATSATPSLCPYKSAIAGYITGENTVTISGSYSNNLLVAADHVTVNHSYVDLGLPSGLLWSKVNLGATTEYGTGNFYSWGNLTGYTLAQNHKFTESDYSGTSGQKLTSNIPANATYDAARATWKGNWRLPTLGEVVELSKNTTKVWTLISNVYGWKCTSKKNSNYVFFPACGHCGPKGYNLTNTYYTFYMGSTLINKREFYGIGIMNSTFAAPGQEAKYSGNLIRPVWAP